MALFHGVNRTDRFKPIPGVPGNPPSSSVGESPPVARTLAIVSFDEHQERGRLRNGPDRLERQRSAMA
jgi:hypothetical protein